MSLYMAICVLYRFTYQQGAAPIKNSRNTGNDLSLYIHRRGAKDIQKKLFVQLYTNKFAGLYDGKTIFFISFYIIFDRRNPDITEGNKELKDWSVIFIFRTQVCKHVEEGLTGFIISEMGEHLHYFKRTLFFISDTVQE